MAFENNVQPVAPSLSISSPRMMSPRSHRSHRSRRSARRGSPQNSGDGNSLELAQAARAAENLRTPDNSNTMNMDPDQPYLAPAGEETIRDIEAQQARDEMEGAGNESNRFVGGFVFDRLKKVVQGASIQWGAGSRRAQGVEDDYYPPYAVSPRQSVAGPSNSGHQRYESSSDDTTHYPATTEEGTTAIDHAIPQQQYIMPAPVDVGSPEFVEPLPADDYRKMKSPSPPPPPTSLSSYVSRLKKVWQDINALPWVGSDRITVDYYPGQLKRRERPNHGIVHKSRSAISMSWYGENYRPPGAILDMQQVDLTAGESPEVKREGIPLQSVSGSGEKSPVYYTTQSGQVWPAVATAYPGGEGEPMPGEVPVSSPDPDYRPFRAPPSPMPEPQMQYLPFASPPTVPEEVHYTNDAGQSWPVVTPVFSAVTYSTTAGHGDMYGDMYGAHVPVAGPSH
ncbi:hypothetical protein V5O48_012143 [Marasmius crinis-equi]|uniref:Uncharacterized protein n=1 Tax=Marasmius crinis-equi TaxID=585013 RepID=A0ABR3F3S6_9AGAR